MVLNTLFYTTKISIIRKKLYVVPGIKYGIFTENSNRELNSINKKLGKKCPKNSQNPTIYAWIRLKIVWLQYSNSKLNYN